MALNTEKYTFYAAECGEFNDLGRFEEFKTLEEAYECYRNFCATSAAMVPDFGFIYNNGDPISDEYSLNNTMWISWSTLYAEDPETINELISEAERLVRENPPEPKRGRSR